MTKEQKDLLFFLFAVVALVGFAITYLILLTTDWGSRQQPGSNFTFVAEALTGLVGGIVAASFGQPLPSPGTGQSGLRGRFIRAGAFLGPPKKDEHKAALAGMYALVYFVTAVWAVVVFVLQNSNTPGLVDTLAIVSLGLFASIISGGFRLANEPNGE